MLPVAWVKHLKSISCATIIQLLCILTLLDLLAVLCVRVRNHRRHVYADVQDLPQQCVVENRNEKMMVSLGLTAMLLELSAMYCTLSCILVMPGKRD